MLHCLMLVTCLLLICITFLKNIPFSQDKVTLVGGGGGGDGIAAQMGFLVIITEGTGVHSRQGTRRVSGQSLIQVID